MDADKIEGEVSQIEMELEDIAERISDEVNSEHIDHNKLNFLFRQGDKKTTRACELRFVKNFY